MSLGPAAKLEPLNKRDTSLPPTSAPSVLTIRPWPIRPNTDLHQPNGPTHCTPQWADQGEKFTSGLMGCLHLELAYKYYFLWKIHENMSPCIGSRVNAKYEWIASWVGDQPRNLDLRGTYSPSIAMSNVPTPQPWPIRQKTGLVPYDEVWNFTPHIYIYIYH